MLSVIIAKPTKACNAACTYCSAAAEAAEKPKNRWTIDDFKHYFDKLVDYIPKDNYCLWLWHGGEPMLLGPKFYLEAYYYAKKKRPMLGMSMQSNILDYSHDKWYDVIKHVCGGSISTSYDPDVSGRVYRGSIENYTKKFFESLQMAMDDGIRTFIIGTYTNDMVERDLHMRKYELALNYGDQAFGIRYNYRYPAGRAKDSGDFISPEVYGNMLIEVYNEWVRQAPDFQIVPHTQILEKIIAGGSRCPWTRHCAGHFIGLEPDGRVWNCASFADLEDDKYCFGDLNTQDFGEIMSSYPAREIKRRVATIPDECFECRNLDVCEGACARDSILFGGDIYDKTKYCESWMMLIDRIKQSVASGEANRVIEKSGYHRKAQARRRPSPMIVGKSTGEIKTDIKAGCACASDSIGENEHENAIANATGCL